MKKVLVLGRSGQILGDIHKVLYKNTEIELLSVSRVNNRPNAFPSIQVGMYSCESINTIISNYEPDVVIYTLAAGSVRSRDDQREIINYINVELPLSIADQLCSMDKSVSMMGFGSFAEYAGYTTDVLIDTKITPLPISDYATSKVRASDLLWQLHGRHGHFNYLHLTLSSVFGGNEHASRLIPQIVKGITNNEIIRISSNASKRDYVYSTDIADCISRLLLSETENRRFICATGEGFTNLEVYMLVRSMFKEDGVGSAGTIMTISGRSSASFIGDSGEFAKLLGHKPSSLSDSTLDMIMPLAK